MPAHARSCPQLSQRLDQRDTLISKLAERIKWLEEEEDEEEEDEEEEDEEEEDEEEEDEEDKRRREEYRVGQALEEEQEARELRQSVPSAHPSWTARTSSMGTKPRTLRLPRVCLGMRQHACRDPSAKLIVVSLLMAWSVGADGKLSRTPINYGSAAAPAHTACRTEL
eukprot:COSAG06_NODE_6165_length_3074_cov_7.266218_3_plen_168_part_00